VHRRPDRDNADARNARILSALPLTQREIGDVVTDRRKPLGEVAVPPFGSADCVWVEAVIDEADTHGGTLEEYVEGSLG
jgi:hypothetical protein